jgi:hypothetical protein
VKPGFQRCLGLAVTVLASVLAVLASDARGAQSAGSEISLPTLTNAHAAHSLSYEESARKYPVHLQAVVSYYDPDADPKEGTLFVCDSSGCIFVAVAARPVLPLHAGTAVEVEGVSGPGDFAPIVGQPKVRVVGESRVPVKASRVSLARMMTGVEDGQWVEIEGVVRSVTELGPHVTLNISTTDGVVSATSPKNEGARYSGLVDAKVMIHANVAPFYNKNRQLLGVRLCFPGSVGMTIEEPSPPDVFALPSRPIDHLLRFEPGVVFLH